MTKLLFSVLGVLSFLSISPDALAQYASIRGSDQGAVISGKESDKAVYEVGAKGGINDGGSNATGPGGAGGISAQVITSGGTNAYLDFQMGQPIMRLKGSGAIYPIEVTTEPIDIGLYGITSFALTFVPATAEGQLALESLKKGPAEKESVGLDRAAFTVSPEFQASVMHLNPLAVAAGGIVFAYITATAGPAGTVAKDKDGTSVSTNPKVGAKGSMVIALTRGHYLDVGAKLGFIPKIVPDLKGDGSVTNIVRAGGWVGYTKVLNSGNAFFARAEVTSDQVDVRPETGPNRDNAIINFVGVTTGVSFK